MLTLRVPTKVDIETLGVHVYDWLTIEVVDPVVDYVSMMKSLFDFPLLTSFLSGAGARRILVDALHGVGGPYARAIFCGELGAPPESLARATPLPDFGGGHPDPNLTYARELVERMRGGEHIFGAAFDGDADRNMILGQGAFFVTPSDRIAVIAANAMHIPYLATSGVAGLARSMPTSGALDRVARDLGVVLYEVPTGEACYAYCILCCLTRATS